MSPDRSSDLLGALPRTRPHRRSAKRPARPTGPAGDDAPSPGTSEVKPTKAAPRKQPERAASSRKTAKAAATARRAESGTARRAESTTARRAEARSGPLPQPAQPGGVPDAPRAPRPEPTTDVPVLRTAVGAAAELAEIGVSLSTRALKRAVGRFPRP